MARLHDQGALRHNLDDVLVTTAVFPMFCISNGIFLLQLYCSFSVNSLCID